MSRKPDWRERVEALEIWIVTALLAGAFVAGAIEAVRYWMG